MEAKDPVLQRIQTKLEMADITVQIQSALVSSTKMKRDALSEKILNLKEAIRKQKKNIQHAKLFPDEEGADSLEDMNKTLETLYEEKQQCHTEMEAVKEEYSRAWEKLKSAWAEQEEFRTKEKERKMQFAGEKHEVFRCRRR